MGVCDVELGGGKRKAVAELVESHCAGRRGVDRVVDCMQAAAIAGKTRLPSGQCIQSFTSQVGWYYHMFNTLCFLSSLN
jgi:hypothetical protein